MIIEACVETLQEAIQAEKNGADRVELCSRLDLDGLTPSEKLIQEVVGVLKIPVMVMIRPREDDFIYSSDEINGMLQSIQMCKKHRIQGIVLGILTLHNKPDLDALKLLVDAAVPLEITFHKAIDATPDPVTSAEMLSGVKEISRILTSGGESTAIEGTKTIRTMQKTVRGKISIIAAGRITRENLKKHIGLIGVNEYHGRKIVGDL